MVVPELREKSVSIPEKRPFLIKNHMYISILASNWSDGRQRNFGPANRGWQRNLVTDSDLALTAHNNHFHIDFIALIAYIGTILPSASSISEPGPAQR
jgi:hypothetical protein